MSQPWKRCGLFVGVMMGHAATALQIPPIASVTPTFSSAFDSDKMDALARRGELEASLMTATTAPLVAPSLSKKKAPSTGGGFGVKKKKNKKKASPSLDPSIALATTALEVDGVVRIDGALSLSTAAALRSEILERRALAYLAVESGDDWRLHFADVLLKSNRCDLLLPLSTGVQTALREMLDGTAPLGNVLRSAIGDDSTLYELAALVSEPGAHRQPVHPDNPFQPHVPLLTAFVALQDVLPDMGPTSFLPRTNTQKAHRDFDERRDAALTDRESRVALLTAGDAALFDSRTLHCGGKNHGATRVLFYVSFKNPRATLPIGNVGSLLPTVKPWPISQLQANLNKPRDGPDPFEVKTFRLEDEQFDLGLCYKRGEGVEIDHEEAIKWFRLAAKEGHALAQCNLGFCYYLGEGVEKDPAEAVQWFELAAEQGEVNAQYNLGYCYWKGLGVEPDLNRAVEMSGRAVAQGHEGAQITIDEVFKQRN